MDDTTSAFPFGERFVLQTTGHRFDTTDRMIFPAIVSSSSRWGIGFCIGVHSVAIQLPSSAVVSLKNVFKPLFNRTPFVTPKDPIRAKISGGSPSFLSLEMCSTKRTSILWTILSI